MVFCSATWSQVAAVLDAIGSTSNRLKLYNKIPPNGLVIYCGTIMTGVLASSSWWRWWQHSSLLTWNVCRDRQGEAGDH